VFKTDMQLFDVVTWRF